MPESKSKRIHFRRTVKNRKREEGEDMVVLFSVSSNSCLLDPGTHALTLLVPQLKGFEFIKDVHLEPVPFDMDRDLITPTYKKKRPQLLKYYQVLLIEILLENLQFIFFICTIAPV